MWELEYVWGELECVKGQGSIVHRGSQCVQEVEEIAA